MTRRVPCRLASLLLLLAVLLPTHFAWSHPIDSSSLTLTEISDGRFTVNWLTTSPTLMRELAQPAVFPKHCRLDDAVLNCGARGLTGPIELPWLAGSETRVMLQIDWHSGSRLVRVVDGRSPRLTVYGTPVSSGLQFLKPIAIDYTRLGMEHILTGYDHLLFVLAITLLVRKGKQLFASITAFTAAHSLTLAATVLGWLWLPPAPVETVIALSIVLVCAECLRPADSLAHRAPWLVTFVFGLLHGLGFASALIAIGLPETHVPSALLFFNVGVELGQLVVIAVFVGLASLMARSKRPPITSRALIYAMGGMAAFWTIERGLTVFAN